MTEPAPPPEPSGEGGANLIDVIRREIGQALDGLFSSGKADVEEGTGSAPPASIEKPLTAAEVQRLARDEMTRAQAELAAKRKAAKATAASASPPAPPAGQEPAPATRGRWEKFQHAIWGEKE